MTFLPSSMSENKFWAYLSLTLVRSCAHSCTNSMVKKMGGVFGTEIKMLGMLPDLTGVPNLKLLSQLSVNVHVGGSR